MTGETTERGPLAAAGGPDPSWGALYRAGAVSAILAVAMYVAALVVFVLTPTPPAGGGGVTMLEYVDAHKGAYVVRQVLWLAPSLPMIIRADFTGMKSSNTGPCTDPFGPNASDAMCSEIQQLEFSETPSGGIVATVTLIEHETWEGDSPPLASNPTEPRRLATALSWSSLTTTCCAPPGWVVCPT